MTRRRTNEEFIELANKVHNNIYNYSKTNYITQYDKVIIICSSHGKFLQEPIVHLNRKIGCNTCFKNLGGNILLDNIFIDGYLTSHNIPISRLGNYINSKAHIDWKCKTCNHIWKMSWNTVSKNGGCPKCRCKKFSEEKVLKLLKEVHPTITKIDPYISMKTVINWKCNICDCIWDRTPNGVINKKLGCPHCNKSKNEKLVEKFFINNNIKYEKITLRFNNRVYYPDFHLVDRNLFVEYNGYQHYEPVCFGGISIEEAEYKYKKQKTRDEELRIYCKNNKIDLLEIDGRIYTGIKLEEYLKNYFLS